MNCSQLYHFIVRMRLCTLVTTKSKNIVGCAIITLLLKVTSSSPRCNNCNSSGNEHGSMVSTSKVMKKKYGLHQVDADPGRPPSVRARPGIRNSLPKKYFKRHDTHQDTDSGYQISVIFTRVEGHSRE